MGSLIAVALLLAPPNAGKLQAQELLKEGQQLMIAEKFAQAAQAFRHAIELDPLLTLAHHGLGQAHMALKQYPAAVIAFRGARDAFQKNVAVDVDRRIETDRARDDRIRLLRDKIREAQERGFTPGSAQARQRDLLVQEWEMEISALLRMRDPHLVPPTPAFLSLALGSAHFRSGQLADAEREYRAALESRPGLGEAHNNLAVVLLLAGRPSEAQEQVRLAEKAGFKVPAGLKKDVEAAAAKVPPPSR